ncbi:MAG: hypothetical protein RIS76_1624 [Verrucomicrobiota bacterium]
MTLLPIAVRELRVSSRRRFTFRVRWMTAASAALLAFAVMAFTDARLRVAGQFLFNALTTGAFLFAVYGGTFLAADAISGERREGTLGLLFLTDLGGLDIVSGKLLVTGLHAFLALLAVLPVVAVAWLLGGVTGGEFWRMALALMHTLMLSLALSLAVSAVQHRHSRAVAWSGGLLTGLVFGVGLLSRLAPTSGGLGTLGALLAVSPWVAVQSSSDAAYRLDAGPFWWSLILGQGMMWMLLGFAVVRTARGWRDLGDGDGKISRWSGSQKESGGGARRLSARLLERNPVLALISARAGLRWWIWGLAAMGSFVVVANLASGGDPVLPFTYAPILGTGAKSPAASLLLTAVLVLIKLLFAWQSCEFWVSGRRDGGLETLLSTPLTDEQILDAQWTALRRRFLGPLILLLTALTVGPAVHAFLIAQTTGATGTGSTNAIAAWGMWMYLLVTLPLDLLALAWMGAWLSLSGAKPGQAFGKTVLLVIVFPMLLFCLPSFLVAGVLFGYARSRMTSPLRSILQGAGTPWTWRKRAVSPRDLYGDAGTR